MLLNPPFSSNRDALGWGQGGDGMQDAAVTLQGVRAGVVLSSRGTALGCCGQGGSAVLGAGLLVCFPCSLFL